MKIEDFCKKIYLKVCSFGDTGLLRTMKNHKLNSQKTK